MPTFDFDLFVIGGGSGGVRAARMAAARGARVALAEAGALGGTCVNLGCIPKKLYSYAAHYAEAFVEAAGYGWSAAPPVLDWERLKARRAAEISRLNQVYQNLLDASGVTSLRGWATLLDGHRVQLNGQVYRARHILLAPGGRPHQPGIKGQEHSITSDQVFDLAPFPKRLVVVGGGYIACEFASIFQGLGAQVTQLYRGPQVLRGFDHEVRDFIAAEMRKAGIELHVQADVAAIQRQPGQPAQAAPLQVQLHSGDLLSADAVLYATGRVPLVEGLGLAGAGVAQRADGAIDVNAQYQTSLPSVYAVGDAIGRVQLTPVALAEAMHVVETLFGGGGGGGDTKPRPSLDYDSIPSAVFTHPNIGTVGYSETDARAKFGAVTVYRSEFKALKHTLSDSSERTLMKLVVDDASDRVVGVHMVGADAGEVVQGFAVALRAGATKALFDSTIGIHPTAAEEFVTMRSPVAAVAAAAAAAA